MLTLLKGEFSSHLNGLFSTDWSLYALCREADISLTFQVHSCLALLVNGIEPIAHLDFGEGKFLYCYILLAIFWRAQIEELDTGYLGCR